MWRVYNIDWVAGFQTIEAYQSIYLQSTTFTLIIISSRPPGNFISFRRLLSSVYQRFEAFLSPLVWDTLWLSRRTRNSSDLHHIRVCCCAKQAYLPRTGADKVKLKTKSTLQTLSQSVSQPATHPVSRLCSGSILHSLTWSNYVWLNVLITCCFNFQWLIFINCLWSR